jgi:uncharacterized protein YgbK (DUF1537 family)
VIYIIADDLTGATDTGVQFSKQGYTTQVEIVAEADSEHVANIREQKETVDVLVIDTETRELDSKTARSRIRKVLQFLPLGENDVVYKKVDSTLRGNVGAELDECLSVLQKDICLFTPSFPQNKRITVEGYLMVQDQPLGLSEYYAGNLDPGEASYIPSLLRQDTKLPIERIDFKDVIHGKDAILGQVQALIQQGNKILVVDAMNDSQLRELLQSSFELKESVLYAGSAGLANALSDLYNGKRSRPPTSVPIQQSTLVVSGSMRSIVRRQIDYLKNRINPYDLPLDVELLVGSKEAYLQQLLSSLTQVLQGEQHHLVIYPDPLYSETPMTEKILSRSELNFRELGLAIRNFLGEFVMRILDKTSTRNLILTGGDTAIGVCEKLGIHQLTIVEELLPGIPLSLGRLNTHGEVSIVTKAGGFGEEDALYVLFEKLVHQRRL